MRFNNIFVIFVCALFIFSLHIGCSKKQEPNKLYEKVLKDKEKYGKSKKYSGDDEAHRERQIAIADACSEKFNSCLAKCGDSSCENQCMDALSSCEKDLPSDLKTLKK